MRYEINSLSNGEQFILTKIYIETSVIICYTDYEL